MAANARSSGSKLVTMAVGGTVGVLGLSTIYLPYFADRDSIRGLHEEANAPTSAMLANEIKKLQKEGILKGEDEDQVDIPKAKAPGSMWSRFKK
jgi:hypothetical protein